MPNPLKNAPPQLDSPALGCFAITPGANPLPEKIRKVTIGTAGGILVYVDWEGEICATGPLPIGDYPLFATHILVSGTPWEPGATLATTTATGLTGWI
jgi:hypothetical protein